MSRFIRTTLVVALLLGVCMLPAQAAPPAAGCEEGVQASSALYRICMPEAGSWNGNLVVFAHGYMAPGEPLRIPDEQMGLAEGLTIADLVTALGFGFATTSYSTNGLAVREGVADLVDLVRVFTTTHGVADRVYLVGASEGGINTALAVEGYPDVFDGGLALCGPVGGFPLQTGYVGDFRAVFDYFFPGLIPGSAVAVPQEVRDNWETIYKPRVRAAVYANWYAAHQLLNVTKAPRGADDFATIEDTILGLLWYSVFATNDATAKLGGQPYGNARRVYSGSADDAQLNLRIQRFRTDPAAFATMQQYYRPSGHLVSPVVTMHTTGDPIVPYVHEPVYQYRVRADGSGGMHVNIAISRYGHCSFTATEVLVGFALLTYKVSGQPLVGAERALPDRDSRAEFVRLARRQGALR